jgi:hypothetical protein
LIHVGGNVILSDRSTRRVDSDLTRDVYQVLRRGSDNVVIEGPIGQSVGVEPFDLHGRTLPGPNDRPGAAGHSTWT